MSGANSKLNLPREEAVVLIPAYHEETHVGRVVRSIRKHGYPHILVIDDGSDDATCMVAGQAGAKVLSHAINRGPGAATQTGLTAARRLGYSYALTMDGDEQHDAVDLDLLLERLVAGADVVIGNRFMRGGNKIPASRQFYNGVANLITFAFSWRWTHDSQSGLKGFRCACLDKLQIQMDGYEFCSELLIKANRLKLKVEEVPVNVYYTEYSRSKGQGLGTGIRTVFNLLSSFLFRS